MGEHVVDRCIGAGTVINSNMEEEDLTAPSPHDCTHREGTSGELREPNVFES